LPPVQVKPRPSLKSRNEVENFETRSCSNGSRPVRLEGWRIFDPSTSEIQSRIEFAKTRPNPVKPGRDSASSVVKQQKKEGTKPPLATQSPYWYHANSPTIILNQNERRFVASRFSRGQIRTGYGSYSVHQDQSSGCETLPRSCWPRISGKPAWPSSPNLNEYLDMLRKGVKNDSPNVRVGGSIASTTLRVFNSNIELAKRVIARNVLAIRSDKAVPVKYRKYFCYRWNFLVLSIHGVMPSGLARFLASVWLTDPFSLWLERKVTLKSYLRELPLSVYNRGVAAFAAHQFDWYASAESSFTSSDCSVSSSQLD